MAAHDGADGHALDFPAMPRGRFVFAVEFVDVDGSLFVHVDNRDVAVRAQADRAFLGIDLPHLCWILTGDLDVLVECQSAFINLRQNQRNSGLHPAKAGDAVPDRWLGQLPVDVLTLFVQRMWRVIRGQGIDETLT